jgi:hypothetical protein
MKRTLPLLNRRLGVLANLFSYPVGLWFTEPTMDQPLKSIGTFLAVLLWLVSFGYLFYRTDLWTFGNAPDNQLDERQNIVRNYAYRYAYILLSTAALGLSLYFMMAIDNHWWLPINYGQASTLFFSLLFLVLILPSAIIAWREREV